ncbi:two-component sensor histidine kinase [Marinobacter salinexigens]|uniref:histidine kinase n=1 Tax=Marinobacter salinexigens TaxID=2919747 RepID=A0A5B0VC27_9GAMM|nr:ATP-binding protein [Marinobacter salinexigens]KAA1172034.1 two-component sensor histidine kinase [Marinobacter salinexigens]
MPLKLFLNLYLRLAGLTGLVIVLCIGLFQGIDSVRSQVWQEQFPEPLMRWLAASPVPEERYHWMAPLYDFTISDARQLELSPIARERLGYGQVVALNNSAGTRLLVLGANGEVLELRVDQLYRDISEAVALIVRWHLTMASVDDRDEVVRSLSDALQVGIRPVEDASSLPSAEVLERVADSSMVFFQDDDAGHVMIRLSSGELLQVDMPPAYAPWAWQVVFLLLSVVGAVLAVTLFLAVREIDGNLRTVESVAVRIARGELGARVEGGDSSLVSRLAKSFNGMAEHIQRLVQVQREMIHAVSHELRTPVARIRFGVQMIEECQDKAGLQKQLDGIDGDIQELDELIDEILTYARLEQGGPVFSLQEGSVTDLVRQVVSEQQLIRPALTIDSQIDEGSEQWALSDIEPRYIHRAIQNLVGNAGRYASSRVLVHCHIDEDNCRVDVEDDGPGIPEADWEKVFTAFARLDDSRTRTSGGYGLGLSIVRRILYWHGGQAFVSKSPSLGGARFSLVWPRKKADDSVL